MDSTQGIFDDIKHVTCADGTVLSVGVAGSEKSDLITFLLLHGAGSSKFTYHYQVIQLKEFYKVVVPDLRSHGLSSASDNLSIDTLLDDVETVIATLNMHRIVVIGHSLGGAIGARLGQHADVSAVIVVDVVEETALTALQHAKQHLATWPTTFPSLEACISWCTSHYRPRSTASAAISIPSLLDTSSAGEVSWKVNLLSSEQHWFEWFQNFDTNFLSLRQPHLLILSHVDRLDTELSRAQMAGQFELQIVQGNRDGGHFIQEDHAYEFITIICSFLSRHGLMSREVSGAILRNLFRHNP